MNEIPLRGFLPATLTVPGGVASWCAAHEEYGRLPLSRDLTAAIEYAREGYPVTGRLARWIEMCAGENALNAHALALFVPNGTTRVPAAGSGTQVSRSVLERIASGGHEGFYAGDTARALASFSRAGGGSSTQSDFHAQQASWGEPLSATYRGVEIFETPPPTQGFIRARDAEPHRTLRHRQDGSARVPSSRTCWCRRSRSPTTTATGCSPILSSSPCRWSA